MVCSLGDERDRSGDWKDLVSAREYKWLEKQDRLLTITV